MNNKLKVFLFILSILLSFVVSIVLWKNISLGYSNVGNVIGYYSENNLSQNNNLIRFIFFIGVPILVFFTLLKNFFFKETNIFDIIDYKEKEIYKENKYLNIFLIIILFAITLNYLSTNLSSNLVDYFHEGLTLTAGFNFYKTGLFWEGSYLTNSLFSDILSAAIPWRIFDHISIGSYRVFHYFLRYLTEILLIFFIYKLSFVFNFKKNTQNIFFLILGLLCLKLNRDLTEIFYPCRYRDIPIFILLIMSVDFIKFERNKILTPFVLGVFATFSILWSMDRGIYYLLGLIFLIFLSLIKRRYLSCIIILIGLSSSCLFFYFYFGHLEFKSFIFNSVNMIKDHSLLIGSPYPTIFDFDNKHASRGTLNLFIIILNGFLLSFLILNQKINLTSGSKVYLIFFFIISCLLYRSALGAPDGYHMKQSIFFSKIFILSNFLFFAFYKNYFDKTKILKILTYSILFVVFSKDLIAINYQNIFSFKERNIALIKKNDDFFFDKKYINFKNLISKKYNLSCVQLFTYDAIVPYLLKKKSCTKFNFVFIVSSEKVQNKMIKELKDQKTDYIFLNQNYNFIHLRSIEERFPKIATFIDENYSFDTKIEDWSVYKRNK